MASSPDAEMSEDYLPPKSLKQNLYFNTQAFSGKKSTRSAENKLLLPPLHLDVQVQRHKASGAQPAAQDGSAQALRLPKSSLARRNRSLKSLPASVHSRGLPPHPAASPTGGEEHQGGVGIGHNKLGGLAKSPLPYLSRVGTPQTPQSAEAPSSRSFDVSGRHQSPPRSPESPLQLLIRAESEDEAPAPSAEHSGQTQTPYDSGYRPASSSTGSEDDLTVAIGGRSRYNSWYEFMGLLRLGKNPKEFVYLRGVDVDNPDFTGNPYDLEIVPHRAVDNNDYYTMSALGVTHFHMGQAEFTPLDQWEREYFLYKQIASLSVFKNFRKWKCFTKLKTAVRSRRKNHQQAVLESNLFILDSKYRDSLLKVREECWKIQQLRLHSMKAGELYTVEEFKTAQAAQAEVAKERLLKFSETVAKCAYDLCFEVIDSLEERLFGSNNMAMKGSLQPDAQYRFAAAKRMVYEEFPQANATGSARNGMKFSYAITAATRAEQKRILNFIRQADYMIANTLHRVLLDSMKDMLRIICPPQLGMKGQRTSENPALDKANFCMPRESVLQVELVAKGPQAAMSFNPSTEEMEATLIGITEEFLDMLGLVARLATHADIVGYFGESVNPKDISVTSNLTEIIVDSKFVAMLNELQAATSLHIREAEAFLQSFANMSQQFQENSLVDAADIRLALNKKEYRLEDFRSDMLRYAQQLHGFEALPDYVTLGILQVNMKRMRKKLVPSPKRCLKVIRGLVPAIASEKHTGFVTVIRDAMRRMTEVPTSLNDLVEYFLVIKDIQSKREEMDETYEEINEYVATIEDFNFQIPEQDMATFKSLEEEFQGLLDQIAYCNATRDALIIQFSPEMDAEINGRIQAMMKIRLLAEHDMIFNENSDPKAVLTYLKPVIKQIRTLQEQAKQINHKQSLFGLHAYDFTSLEEVADFVQLEHLLWNSQVEWVSTAEVWKLSTLEALDLSTVDDVVANFNKTIAKIDRDLMPNRVLPKFKKMVQEWKDLIPIFRNLRNPDMKDRHWVKIQSEIGHDLQKAGALTIGNLLDMHIGEAKDIISAVTSEASNEATLESMLRKVQEKWVTTDFIVNPYKDTKDTYVLGGVEDVMAVVDESFIMMASITSSRYVAGVRGEVNKLESSLKLFSNTLDEWLECQKNWVYLESIFSAPDIQRQLPKESKDFLSVSRMFKDVMKRTKERPNALMAATQPGLIETFQRCNGILEHVQNNLESYLELKRTEFPRFYFLSNDALLEILSQTKNPQAVQPHLQKCFEGITSLDFGPQERSIDILAMNGVEGERISLGRNLKARGNVEQWLSVVEHNMKQALQTLAKKGWKDYPLTNRVEWVKRQPAQLTLVVSNIFWCASVETALKDTDVANELGYLHESLVDQLQALCTEVRLNIPSLNRKVIVALITIDVHNRDIVKLLESEGVTNPEDFSWQKHLRYYYDAEYEQINIRQSMATFGYGLEYLGAQPRLVMTPMTDRCYMTLTGALHLKLGGAPTGPAGTGKTETTKDLGKALGIPCVVFNCAENLDYKFMAKFFSGLAQCGAWACFDEFNRIDVEVLSVVAQQLMTIQNALRARMSTFVFEGKVMPLVHSCGVVITQNPGYAGRSELPDNLKALFRPVSMMIPDYALVAEVMLFSEGFNHANSLSRKMVMLYKLSSEQLSQQDHYDFGLRALKSVLVMAGALKREAQALDEEIVLIRAMRDANIPKFLRKDAELFNAIVGDLFPGLEIPEQDYGDLKECVIRCSEERKLQPLPSFVLKVIQLYETFNVRFGVMLVGPAGGGKTEIYNILRDAATLLRKEKNHPDQSFQETFLDVLYPKAVNIGELYGEYNALTSEWSDGLASKLVRKAINDHTVHRRWIVFDGPVDALWIENMNTVLDDTCTLCLPNGERIKLNPITMRLLFEVKDLSKASPATVSRCGMVYIPKSTAGWKPFAKSWISSLSSNIPGINFTACELLQDLLDLYVDKGLKFLRSECQEPIPCSDISVVESLTRYLQCLLQRYVEAEAKAAQGAARVSEMLRQSSGRLLSTDDFLEEEVQSILENIFCFSFIWGVGGSIDRSSWDRFDAMVRNEFGGRSLFPNQSPGHVFDYYLNPSKGWSFSEWNALIPEYSYLANEPFHDILVPTVDTTRYTYMLQMALEVERGVILTGMSGVGKTRIVQRLMAKEAAAGSMHNVVVNFSAQTSSAATQLYIESKLEKKRKNRYGAPYGKRVLLFIDDINMPQKEQYGAQPPVELLRQCQELRGWYDRKKFYWRAIDDMSILAACAPPGGGRQELCTRFTSCFSILCMPPASEHCMRTIFENVLSGHLQSGFPKAMHSFTQPMVMSTIELFLQLSTDLLPTPAKSHYTFNLRDVSKVFQGILLMKPHKVPAVSQTETMTLLWVHEVLRVFHDRLNTAEDQTFVKSLVFTLVKQKFNGTMTYEELFDDAKPTMFGNWLHMGLAEEERDYERIAGEHIPRLPKLMEEYQDEYNHGNTTPAYLVFFQEAIEHISRLNRILAQPRGHAMIVGMGGNGKQTLSRFAAFMQEMVYFQVESTRGYGHNEFREDLKQLYQIAGAEGSPVMFLLSDKQNLSDAQIEDVSNMLSNGEVRGLFQKDELDHILGEFNQFSHQRGGSAPTAVTSQDVIYNEFINRVRNNLHIVLAMSPVGEGFRSRCLRFPALVNCCTIDWFFDWPEEALLSVSHIFLEKGQFTVDSEVTASIAKMSVEIHVSISEASRRFYAEVRRHVYVTSKTFLDFISTFLKLLGMRREEDISARDGMLNGLHKLHQTNETVARMKADLDALKPVLQERRKKTAELLAAVEKERAQAQKLLHMVTAEENEVLVKTDATMEMKNEAQKDLESALPPLRAANRALSALNKADITEIKSFSKPPYLVQLTMEGVCILLQEKPDWDQAKRLLNDTSIVKRLMEYDKDNMSDVLVRRLRRITDDPEFMPELVAKQSNAARSMCLWVRAMETYAKVLKDIRPKQHKLEEAEEALKEMEAELQEKRNHLDQINMEVAELEKQLSTTESELQDLQSQVDLSNERLQRAVKLTAALGEESKRWEDTAAQISANMSLIVGDVFLSSAIISYCGSFTGTYRDELVQKWRQDVEKYRIPASANFSLQNALATPAEVHEWRMQGLPTDTISVDNAIMVMRAQLWPMLIDPQMQANHWLKVMEAQNGLHVVNYTEPNLMVVIEAAMQAGTPLLVEDFGESMDPVLEPLLSKQTFVQGGRQMIRLGDTDMEYNESFRFYMTTKIANPHFLPEVAMKVNVINFTVTHMGLVEQLLALVVRREHPELEEQMDRLVVSISNDRRQLKELEDKILKMLEDSTGNILDDEVLVNTLNTSKLTSAVIKGRVREAELAEKELSASRNEFRSVPERGSILYFTIAELANIDNMYQHSLKYFTRLFTHCLSNAEAGKNLDIRLKNLTDFMTRYIFTMVCRGLFDGHKRVFAFLLAVALGRHTGEVPPALLNFLLRGGHSHLKGIYKPDAEWITDSMWQNVIALSNVGYPFTSLASSVKENKHVWHAWVSSGDPFSMPLPDVSNLEGNVAGFAKLLLVKVFCEEKLVPACNTYVRGIFGEDFLDLPVVGISNVYKETSSSTPVIFVLQAGVDPTPLLKRFASTPRHISEDSEDHFEPHQLHIISLGQGQGPIAERTIKAACANGSWVCLQNCHLARSWMPSMELIVDELERDMDVHPSFRLWLTSMPSPHFPVSVLQSGLKVAMEPPKGVRANLKRSFANMQEGYLLASQKPEAWRKLVFSLTFFHAVIQERRKFGPLGWNTPYDFSDGDLSSGLETVQLFLNLPGKDISWEALQYVLGEINYGGRVTDENDRRLLRCVIKTFLNSKVLEGNYSFSADGEYVVPRDSPDFESYAKFIQDLPESETPAVFAMHNNADISFQIAEARKFIEVVLNVQPRVIDSSANTSGTSHDELVCNLAAQILADLPSELNAEAASYTKNPFAPMSTKHANSLTIVLTQEMERFNSLVGVLKSSLTDLQRAVQGLVVMSPNLDEMYNSLLNNQLPQLWKESAYPSLKPLASWISDFRARMSFFDKWIKEGQPACFWLPAFFFPQGFLTATLQNHARKNSTPIDQISFRFLILRAMDESSLEGQVPDGVLVKGLYLEGAAWDRGVGRLTEARLGEMYSPLPIIHFSPVQVLSDPPTDLYQCPLYKTAVRAGTLSTTGQSTNFILYISLPAGAGQSVDKWILRGVAALCSPPE